MNLHTAYLMVKQLTFSLQNLLLWPSVWESRDIRPSMVEHMFSFLICTYCCLYCMWLKHQF